MNHKGTKDTKNYLCDLCVFVVHLLLRKYSKSVFENSKSSPEEEQVFFT
jgi:hypothetical protein